MKKEYQDYVEDIMSSISKIEQFVEGMTFEDFSEDDKTVFAVIRALEVIGEAAKNIPPPMKNKYSQIPWREISGMRDKLIHEYFGVNIKVVWDTVKSDIPAIKPLVYRMLKELEK
jgi:uncharacterized protein with HEPN domain